MDSLERDLTVAALRYVEARAKHTQALLLKDDYDCDYLASIDEGRKRSHDAFLSALAAMARQLPPGSDKTTMERLAVDRTAAGHWAMDRVVHVMKSIG